LTDSIGTYKSESKAIKIAFFTKELPSDSPNGVSCQAHRLANALVELGEQVTCFSFSEKPSDALYEVVKLRKTVRNRIFAKFEAGFKFAALRTAMYDVLHFHGDDYLCRGSSRRVRTFYGSALYEALYAGSALRALRQALFYILEWLSCLRRGASVGISKTTVRALPLVQSVIHCGVPLSCYVPGRSKTPYPSVLFVGDCDSRKRGRLLAGVFGSVIAAAAPDAKLCVVGPQECSGPGIVYRGRLDEKELIGEYQRAWVYCCPSSYEGFGVPLLEAMACGTAVVACDNAGVREIVNHNYNGLLCMPETLGASLHRLLSDNILRARLVANGAAFVKRYDIGVIARQYLDLYRSLQRKASLL
jgi:glycosyltransferase involved in cell wall biosynthesis